VFCWAQQTSFRICSTYLYVIGRMGENINKEIKQKFTGSLSFIVGKLKIPITLLYMDLQKRRKVLTLLPLYSTFPELYFH